MKHRRIAAWIAVLAAMSLAVTPIAVSADEANETETVIVGSEEQEEEGTEGDSPIIGVEVIELISADDPDTGDEDGTESETPGDCDIIGSEPADDDPEPVGDITGSADEDPYQYFKDLFCSVVKKDYAARTGNTAADAACILPDEESDLVTVTLTDAEGNVLDVYSFDGVTGIGTNKNGDPVDLSEYAQEVPEDEYYVPFDLMSDTAHKCYEKKTGVYTMGAMTQIDMEDGTKVIISLYGDGQDPVEVYTVDLRTGIGTDSAGEEVDLSEFADEVGFTEDDCFIDPARMDDAARGYYTEQTETEPAATWLDLNMNIPKAEITFFDEDDNELESYTIDPTTGIGTDKAGNPVDLAAYAQTHEITDSEESDTDESEYFVPSTEIFPLVCAEYLDKTGTELDGMYMYPDSKTLTATIELIDPNDAVLDTYTIDLRTGKGTDSKGDPVDLTAYIGIETPEYISTLDGFADMAVTDYMMTTGKSAKWSKAEVSMDGKTVTVTLTDDDYNPVETYTIDPYTGKGVTASGASVDLPQTGNNDPAEAAAAGFAVMLLLSGIAACSFTLRKRRI